MDSRKLTFEKFLLDKRGQATLDYLWDLARDTDLAKKIHRTQGKGEIAKFYQEQYEGMLKKRAQGVLGWLNFKGWTYEAKRD